MSEKIKYIGFDSSVEMQETSEHALLLAIETRDDLFNSIQELVSSENYLKVLPEIEEGKTQGEIAEEAGVSRPTVSRAISDLKEIELVEETEEGYRLLLPVLEHPVLHHFFEEEVLNDG